MTTYSKKLTATVLMTALVASSIVATPKAAEAKTFNDVPKNHWAYDVIDEVSNHGAMNGTATNVFAPTMVLSRAQFTTVLYNITPSKANGNGVTNFTDVPDNAWYKTPAYWGVSNGIIFADAKGRFKAETAVTREYMAYMIYNFIDKYYPNALDKSAYDAKFTDADQFSKSYYLEKANILAHNGLVAGQSANLFAPQATLTRAEAAAMASRVMAFVKDETPQTPENPPVDPEPEQPPVEEPETPPVEVTKPYPGDENAPEWMIKIGIRGENGVVSKYTYITKPDYLNQEQWETLKAFYKDKERPSYYNEVVSYSVDPQAWMNMEIEQIYNDMQKVRAKEALEEGTVQLTAEEQKMVELVNQARREAGVPELKVSPKLCEAAKIRAEEANIKYSHTRPDGTSCVTVFDDVGLNIELLNNIMYLGFGENISGAYGAKPESATEAFQGLMDSPKHRANLLSVNHDYIGIGVQGNGTDSAWVQLFSSAR